MRAALAAVLVDHVWAEAFDDAVGRMGGVQLATGFVEADGLADVAPTLVAAVAPQPPR